VTVRDPMPSGDLARLNRVFRETLNVPAINLTPATTANDVAGWDSLTHVNLVLAIEKEYNTRFTLSELEEFVTIADLLRILKAKKV
jgi:acyl carrier protein